jgi:hypothetical protein
MKMAVLIFSVVASLCAVAVLAAWLIPGWLEASRLPVVRVRAKMTNADREARAVTEFSQLYEELDDQPIESYLPARKTGAHGFITTVARLNSVAGRISSPDDVLTDSPDPANKVCIDAASSQTVSVATVDALLSQVKVGAAIMLAFCIVAALFCHRRSLRANVARASRP